MAKSVKSSTSRDLAVLLDFNGDARRGRPQEAMRCIRGALGRAVPAAIAIFKASDPETYADKQGKFPLGLTGPNFCEVFFGLVPTTGGLRETFKEEVTNYFLQDGPHSIDALLTYDSTAYNLSKIAKGRLNNNLGHVELPDTCKVVAQATNKEASLDPLRAYIAAHPPWDDLQVMAPFLLEAATIQGIFEAGPAAFLKLDQPALALARMPLPPNLNGLVNRIQTIKRLCHSTSTVVTSAQQLRAARAVKDLIENDAYYAHKMDQTGAPDMPRLTAREPLNTLRKYGRELVTFCKARERQGGPKRTPPGTASAVASGAPAVVRRSVKFSDSLSQSAKVKQLFKAKRENDNLKSEKAKLARDLKSARRQHNSAAPPSEDVAHLSEQVAILQEQVDELRTLVLSSGVSNSTPSRTASAAAAPAMSVAEQELADFRAHKKLEKERATEMKRLEAMTACMKPLIQDVMKDCMTHTLAPIAAAMAAHGMMPPGDYPLPPRGTYPALDR